jgi:beta-glucosidase-like glycosyl hydrolase
MVKESSKSIRKKISQLLMPRLEGNLLTEPPYFEKIKTLLEGGIRGFILFGGKKKDVKKAIKELQRISEIPLFIASDLEQGLGQQVEGGTIFPKAMAIGSAIDPNNTDNIRLLRETINIMALEAKEVGINVILAPVLDVNTNPKNPIICTRAFSETPSKVGFFGREFIRGIQSAGLIACGKHFPGHGDTEIDSHIDLPVMRSSIARLRKVELYPFIEAIKSRVKMIMVGHLLVESLDPERPASHSYKVITGLLRKKLGFNGLVITDAMNMGAIKSLYGENESCFMVTKAGADIILHPENPEYVIEYLSSCWEEIEIRVEESLKRILKIKENTIISVIPVKTGIQKNRTLDSCLRRNDSLFMVRNAEDYLKSLIGRKKEIIQILSDKSIKVLKGSPKFTENSIALILDDDNSGSGKDFIKTLKIRYPKLESFYIDSKNIFSANRKVLNKVNGRLLTIGIFSNISAWKGRSSISPDLYKFLKRAIKESKSSTVVSFGCPHILDGIEADTLIAAYWDSESAQRAAANLICGKKG